MGKISVSHGDVGVDGVTNTAAKSCLASEHVELKYWSLASLSQSPLNLLHLPVRDVTISPYMYYGFARGGDSPADRIGLSLEPTGKHHDTILRLLCSFARL